MILTPAQALELWRMTTAAGVRRDAPDLTARQMALPLTVCPMPPPHTARGLAKRRADDDDRRNIFVQPTVKGSVYPRDLAGSIMATAAGLQTVAPPDTSNR